MRTRRKSTDTASIPTFGPLRANCALCFQPALTYSFELFAAGFYTAMKPNLDIKDYLLGLRSFASSSSFVPRLIFLLTLLAFVAWRYKRPPRDRESRTSARVPPARRMGPNITDWPKMQPLAENLLVELAAVLHDPVTFLGSFMSAPSYGKRSGKRPPEPCR